MIEAFRTLIEDTSGLTTRYAQQNSPRPARPYITLYVLNTQALGLDESSYVEDDDVVVQGPRLYQVSLQYIAKESSHPFEAVNALNALRNQIRALRNQDALAGQVFSVIQDNPVLNTTTTVDSRYTPQATWDLSLVVAETTSLPQYSFDTFEAQLTPST